MGRKKGKRKKGEIGDTLENSDSTDSETSEDKYVPYKIENYSRQYPEDGGNFEYLVIYESSDQNVPIGDRDLMSLGAALKRANKGIKRFKRINKYKIGAIFERPGLANAALTNAKSLNDLHLKATIPASLTEITGVIFSVPTYMSNKSIYNGISSSKDVVSVRRLMRRSRDDDGKTYLQPTQTVAITFSCSTLPDYVDINSWYFPYPYYICAHNIDEGHRTQDVQISHDITFDSMLLAANTLQGLKNSGFNKPSPIQLLGIPLGKCGFDLILEAKSGTGKTAVFTVIALEKIDFTKGLQVVILAPTREIAAQICDVIKHIGSHYKDLQVEVVMGGLPIKEDIAKFKNKKVHVVVGSPGRLHHLIREKHIDTSAVRLLVFDEADKLMDRSFQSDIKHICTVLPKQKQVLMSSATYPEDTKSFINKHVQNAQHVCPDTNKILLGIQQKVTVVKYHSNIVRQTKHRFEELLKILKTRHLKQCLIFCNYQARVSELCKMLKIEKWPAEQLHGQQEQTDRLDALKSLQEYKCRILIATDLAARGIDASNVDLVINFEPPFDWQTYLHRIGRAGRFGSYGIAVTLLSEGKEEKKFKEMLGSIKASLNLSNLWNDEMFNIDDSDTSLSSLVSETSTDESPVADTNNKEFPVHGASVYSDKKVKYGELWNLLNKPIQEEEIDSFDKLCISFNESNDSKIESFHDLLSSYQTNLSSANIDITKNVDMEVPLRKNYIRTIQNMIEPTQKVFSQDTVSCKKECSTYHDTKNKIEANNKNEEEGTVDRNKVCSTDMRIKDGIDRHNNIQNRDYQEYEEENITEALIKAGLPTSFGNPNRNQYESRKHKKRSNRVTSNNREPCAAKNCYNIGYSEKTKTRNKISDLEAGTSDANNDLHSAEVLKPLQKSSKYKNSKTRNHERNSDDLESVEDEYDDCGYNTLSHQYSSRSNVTYTKYSNSTTYTKNYYNKNPNGATCNRKSCYTESECDRTNQTYINWYNQLKYRVKQIEIAAYIEEISKIW